jgi:cytochrome c553
MSHTALELTCGFALEKITRCSLALSKKISLAVLRWRWSTLGRSLFLKNCAHCPGADAHGDEGPDLHNLDWTDEQITTRIRNGKAGQMTAFAGKLSADQINQIKDYVRTLK